MAMWAQQQHGGGTGQSDDNGTGQGGDMWPCGHSQNVVMAQGNNMEVASGMDVTHGHQAWQGDGDGTGQGCDMWPCGHGK